MGAAVLAARASLRAGLGLLTVHAPECGYEILQSAVPEAMAHVDEDPRIFSGSPDLSSYTAIGIGPGLGQDARTVKALGRLLENFDKPMVIDADALNILGGNRELMGRIPPGSILTPHPKEFERLTGPWKDDFERLKILRELAVSLKSVIVLKGAHTSIATDKGVVWFNSTGNPGMATAGTGDVLTGILTGLLAQKYTADEAAIVGVFLHGLAGDLAVSERGMDALIASDIIGQLPGAYLKVVRREYLKDF
jgi:NAD(P)H-hydrate epimerase